MSWLGTWSKRIKLTVDNTNVDSTLSDFPVLVKLSDSSGISSTDVTSVFTEFGSDANRKKIAVTTSDGETQCYVEIERFDFANSLAWLWVKVPSVASDSVTELYIYYDSLQADNTTYVGDTTDAVTHNVWDSNFKLVMHMAQDPNGDVADAIKDSTSNANHGTPGGVMTSADLIDGKIGKGIDFDDVDDNINVGDITSLNGLTTATWESTVKNNVGVKDRTVIARWIGLNNQFQIWMDEGNDKWQGIVRDDSNNNIFIQPGLIAPSGDYQYVVMVLNGTNLNLYVDLADGGSNSDVSFESLMTVATDVYIGDVGDNTRDFNDIIDELRISDIARSDAWRKATYYSNWDGLVSFGSEEIEAVNYISGYVKEGTIPANRQIYLHNRDTGALITSTTSSGAGGYFYMETTYSGAHYVVCLDDVAGVDYNDLIYGNIYPVTVSG